MSRVSKEDKVIYKDAEGNTLVLSDSFIYEVDIFRCSNDRYSLEDSKYVKATKEQSINTQRIVKDNQMFKQSTTLVGAPLKWLTEKKYTLCQE